MCAKRKQIDLKMLMESNAMKRPENQVLKPCIIQSSNRVVTDLDKQLEDAAKRKKAEKKKERNELHSLQDMYFVQRLEEYGIRAIPEYKFHSSRGWRIDFYIEYGEVKLAVEVEGGVFQRNPDGSMGGRHNKAEGYIQDMEKYNEMTKAGIYLYRVIRDEFSWERKNDAKYYLQTSSIEYSAMVTRGLNHPSVIKDILKIIRYDGKRNNGTLFG